MTKLISLLYYSRTVLPDVASSMRFRFILKCLFFRRLERRDLRREALFGLITPDFAVLSSDWYTALNCFSASPLFFKASDFLYTRMTFRRPFFMRRFFLLCLLFWRRAFFAEDVMGIGV